VKEYAITAFTNCYFVIFSNLKYIINDKEYWIIITSLSM